MRFCQSLETTEKIMNYIVYARANIFMKLERPINNFF